MGAPAVRSIHLLRSQVNYGWSRDHPPATTVASEAKVTLETADASGGQFTASSTASAIASLDFAKAKPATGPMYVEGAHPGDVLQIDLLEIEPGSWGWTGQIPGFGLLADQVPDPWLPIWPIEGPRTRFQDRIAVPVEPFCGVIGLAPAEPGLHSVVPPRRVVGNMDIKQLRAGATVYLPVEVEGALLGIGDTHAAQDDGEVCGTAIECPMAVTVRLSVRRDLNIDTPEYDVHVPLERRSAAQAGYQATSGVGPDLMQATRQSIERMIVHLERVRTLDAQPAYAPCSVAVDLKISEVVDAPNWIVSAFLPSDLFER